MDFVLAKVKRIRKKPYQKLLSDIALFDEVDINVIHTVEYNPDHNLDEDSWFIVKDFASKDYFPNELSKQLDSKDFDELGKDRFGDLSCILSIQSGDVYFQKVTPAAYLRRKTIRFGEAATLEENANRIILRPLPDAVYCTGKDCLLFRDIAAVSSIFKGIDELYKEATDAEVQSFLGSDFIEVMAPFDHSSVSKPNRKRLALVSDTIQGMTENEQAELIDYIREYCVDDVKLTGDGKKIEISSDKQLKLTLYGIEERFYTTHRSHEKRLANSVEKIS